MLALQSLLDRTVFRHTFHQKFSSNHIQAHISSEIQFKSDPGTHFIRNSVQITFRHTFIKHHTNV
jgi:hypothetical protein